MKNLVYFLCLTAFATYGKENFKKSMVLMGCNFEITVVANDREQGYYYIENAVREIERIESLISSWNASSETNKINKNAGKVTTIVSKELFSLIERSIEISKLTQGAFDISYASMDNIWKFDGSMKTLPTARQIKKSVENIGFENILLNKSKRTVLLKHKGMKIGFGAIGKGYAADSAKRLLQSQGVISGIINASGDLNAWGNQANGKEWMVAITNPLNKNKAFSWMPVLNSAVVTSGNYEKFVSFNGTKFSHIIDPRTGYPSKGIKSVTVFTKHAELADAISTSLFVMGIEVGLNFINQLKDVECVFIDENNKIHNSKHISFNELI